MPNPEHRRKWTVNKEGQVRNPLSATLEGRDRQGVCALCEFNINCLLILPLLLESSQGESIHKYALGKNFMKT